jgi:hypothetical protein
VPTKVASFSAGKIFGNFFGRKKEKKVLSLSSKKHNDELKHGGFSSSDGW